MAKKVLVVDDDLAIVRMIEFKLKNVGFEVIPAFDGEEALAEILESLPDLVIADITMPGLTGVELTSYLKSNPLTQNIPVIILTSHGEDETKTKAKEAGADEVINKPFASSKLVEIIKRKLFTDNKV